MHKLIGKEVEVVTAETTYRGLLIEVGEYEIQLQSEYGWVSLPLDMVSDVRAADKPD